MMDFIDDFLKHNKDVNLKEKIIIRLADLLLKTNRITISRQILCVICDKGEDVIEITKCLDTIINLCKNIINKVKLLEEDESDIIEGKNNESD